jgi:catechol 2,3-dioxygenase-like lactoylglutathione lyase family enzyme
MILKMHHAQITIPAKDITASRHFYLQELGMIEVEKPEAFGQSHGILASRSCWLITLLK